MKLRNKETGEIREARIVNDHFQLWSKDIEQWVDYDDFDYLAKWWKRYEEPKSINEIDVVLDAIGEYCNEHSHYSGDLEKIKILNIVEEKLKAWKRLKDKGAEFKGWGWEAGLGNYVVLGTKDADHLPDEIEFNRRKDLDLLFGGKE